MISVFLSSTFQDMHHERDLIHKYVYPIVCKEAMKYGETVHIIDLRWGIDTYDLTTQEAMDKVLRICSEKVNETAPFFIALLGKRYGSKIDCYLKRRLPKEISVTEFEINTCLSNTSNNPFFFIRRDIDFINFDSNQQQLIMRIMNDYPERVVEYRLTENDSVDLVTDEEQVFIQQVVDKILEYIAYYVSNNNTTNKYEQYIAECAAFLYGRDDIVSQLYRILNLQGKQMIFLYGPHGIGKRSILYLAINQIDCHTVRIGGQVVVGQMSANTIMKTIVKQIENFVETLSIYDNEDFESFEKDECRNIFRKDDKTDLHIMFWKLSQMFKAYMSGENRPLAILIEDIDSLLDANEVRRFFNIIENVKLPIKWCVTGSSETCILDIQNSDEWTIKRIPFLLEKDRISIIEKTYAKYSKKLPDLPLKTLLQKKASFFPEYIHLLSTWMVNFEQKDIVKLSENSTHTDKQGNIIAQNMQRWISSLPDDTISLYGLLLETLGSQVPQWASRLIFEWLNYCTKGLREEDLQSIVEISCKKESCYSEIDFYLAFGHLQQILCKSPDGVWSLKYKNAKKIGFEKIKLQKIYVKYLESLSVSDPIRTRDLLLQYVEMNLPDAFYRELSFISEQRSEEFAEQIQIILDNHIQWFMETIPQYPNEHNLKAVSSFVTICINTELSHKQYEKVKQYLCCFMEKVQYLENINISLEVFRVGKIASLLASLNDDAVMLVQWGAVSDEARNFCLTETDGMQLSEPLSELIKLIQLNLNVFENLAEARSILDRGLPAELCLYVLSETEKNIQTATNICGKLGVPKEAFVENKGIKSNLCELKGDCYVSEHNYSAAIANYEMGVYDICARKKGKTDYQNLNALFLKIGVCYLKQGKTEEAILAYKDAVKSIDYVLELTDTIDNRVRKALTKSRIAEIYVLKGNYEEAILLLISLKNIFKMAYQKLHTIQSMHDYAVLCYKILEYEHQGKIDLSRGRKYGRKAIMLFINLEHATNDPQYSKNIRICLEKLDDLNGYF